jgi:hypothetical protein
MHKRQGQDRAWLTGQICTSVDELRQLVQINIVLMMRDVDGEAQNSDRAGVWDDGR